MAGERERERERKRERESKESIMSVRLDNDMKAYPEYELFVFDRNTLNYISLCNLFLYQMLSLNFLQFVVKLLNKTHKKVRQPSFMLKISLIKISSFFSSNVIVINNKLFCVII